jgi:hypothetical protein
MYSFIAILPRVSHFCYLASFAVNQPYSYVDIIGEGVLISTIRTVMPSLITGLQIEDIKDVSVHSTNGNY